MKQAESPFEVLFRLNFSVETIVRLIRRPVNPQAIVAVAEEFLDLKQLPLFLHYSFPAGIC